MPGNQDWVRWIWASVSKWFDDRKQGTVLYLDGFDIDQVPPKDCAELRMNGPFMINPSRNYWHMDIEINILLQITPDNEDAHKLWRYAGIYINAMAGEIPVYKYGDGIQDDQSLLGCLRIRPEKGEEIVLANFGRVDPDIEQFRSGLSAFYRLEITTNDN
jgi:hypothetical protein